MIKKLLLLSIFYFLFGCSIEEHNRRAVAERATNITNFKERIVGIASADVTQRERMTIVYLPSEPNGVVIERGKIRPVDRPSDPRRLYFTDEGHIAHPSVIIHESPFKKDESYWTWVSAASKENLNDWLLSFWNSEVLDGSGYQCDSPLPEPERKGPCPVFATAPIYHYKDSYLDISFDLKNKCLCGVE